MPVLKCPISHALPREFSGASHVVAEWPPSAETWKWRCTRVVPGNFGVELCSVSVFCKRKTTNGAGGYQSGRNACLDAEEMTGASGWINEALSREWLLSRNVGEDRICFFCPAEVIEGICWSG